MDNFDKPYDEENEGGKKINKLLICIGFGIIGYCIYSLINLGFTKESKEDLYVFLGSCFVIIGAFWLIRRSFKNLKHINQEKSWRK